MFTSTEIASTLEAMQVTHVIWLPDSTLGPWEEALEASEDFQLLRVCREGEAWPLAAGLLVGGKAPIIMMQSTGLFESGDAMRNVWFDLALPVFAVVGARNWLNPDSADSARSFIEPISNAWGLNPCWIACDDDKPMLASHYRDCLQKQVPGMVLLAEGAG